MTKNPKNSRRVVTHNLYSIKVDFLSETMEARRQWDDTF